MSKVNKVVEKAKDVAEKVDVDTVEENLGIVIDTVERINKTNTTSKADNIQRGVQDARKVLGVVRFVRSVLSAFTRK
mgnify:CR=1 FL=1